TMILVPLFLILLHQGTSQYLENHLLHHLDRNVSACDNFYRHVCGGHVKNDRFAPVRVENFYKTLQNITSPLQSMANPIWYDFVMSRRNKDQKKSYKEMAELRQRHGCKVR
ncbi:hypothetical protein PFISCL1PPCAC_27933, partial [Pristionchus fissidentatus]